jgi:DNA-binding NarL/FixJ family response regulator
MRSLLMLWLDNQRSSLALNKIMGPSPYRATIVHLVDHGLKKSEIARRLQMNARIVKRIAQQYHERGYILPHPKSGRFPTASTA